MNLLSFIGLSYFSHKLGSAQMGIFFLFQMLLGILQIPAGFGINDALEKRISAEADPSSIFATASVLKVLPLITIVVAILLFKTQVNNYVGADVALLLGVAIILQEYAELLLKLINGELRVGDTALIRLVYSVVWVGFGIILIRYGLQARGLIYAVLGGFVAMLLFGLYRRETQLGTPSRKHVSSLFNYARYAFVNRGGQYVHNWMDIAIIGFLLTSSAVGAYEVAWRVASLPLLFSSAIAMSVFPEMSSIENHPEQIGEMLSSTFVPALVLVIPSFFGLGALSHEILTIFFGPDFSVAWGALILIMAGNVIGTFDLLMTRGLWAVDRPDITAKITVIAAIFNISLNGILIWKFGLVGAAVATSIATLVGTLLTTYMLRKHVPIQFPKAEIGWCFFASAIMFGVVQFAKTVVNITTIIELLGIIMVGVVTYSGILVVHQSFREQIETIRKRALGS